MTRSLLTIGQLAQHVGCTISAVRLYHARGLLPAPERDASGYRRYDAQAVIALTRVVALARSGVPLADIPAILDTADEGRRATVAHIDARIAELQRRRARLAMLKTPDRIGLPDVAVALLDRLRELGCSERYVTIERDCCLLGSATMPSLVEEYLPVKLALLSGDAYARVLHGYDDALEWSPADPRIDDLARASVAEAERITAAASAPAARELPSAVGAIVAAGRGEAPAWGVLGERTRQLAGG